MVNDEDTARDEDITRSEEEADTEISHLHGRCEVPVQMPGASPATPPLEKNAATLDAFGSAGTGAAPERFGSTDQGECRSQLESPPEGSGQGSRAPILKQPLPYLPRKANASLSAKRQNPGMPAVAPSPNSPKATEAIESAAASPSSINPRLVLTSEATAAASRGSVDALNAVWISEQPDALATPSPQERKAQPKRKMVTRRMPKAATAAAVEGGEANASPQGADGEDEGGRKGAIDSDALGLLAHFEQLLDTHRKRIVQDVGAALNLHREQNALTLRREQSFGELADEITERLRAKLDSLANERRTLRLNSSNSNLCPPGTNPKTLPRRSANASDGSTLGTEEFDNESGPEDGSSFRPSAPYRNFKHQMSVTFKPEPEIDSPKHGASLEQPPWDGAVEHDKGDMPATAEPVKTMGDVSLAKEGGDNIENAWWFDGDTASSPGPRAVSGSSGFSIAVGSVPLDIEKPPEIEHEGSDGCFRSSTDGSATLFVHQSQEAEEFSIAQKDLDEHLAARQSRRDSCVSRLSFLMSHDVPQGTHNLVLPDKARMKKKLQEELITKDYNVADFYYETGCMQFIARSQSFEIITLTIIAVNAVWIAVDIDQNNATSLVDAGLKFQIAENFFCGYFFLEWFIRLCAFKNKRNCIKDGWFNFDSILCFQAVFETWFVYAYAYFTGGGGFEGLGPWSRLLKMLRMGRTARIVRILRQFPELVMMLKGLGIATRSVFFVTILMMTMTYVLAICMKMATEGTEAGAELFPSVWMSMRTMLILAVVPDLEDSINMIDQPDDPMFNWLSVIVFVLFIFVVSLTMLNMLVGVLCAVVDAIRETETEKMEILHMKHGLMDLIVASDDDDSGCVSITEFVSLLNNPVAVQFLKSVDIDASSLIDFAETYFKRGQTYKYEDIISILLDLRGHNRATVKDITELRKWLDQELDELRTNVKEDTSLIVNSIVQDVGNSREVHGLMPPLGRTRTNTTSIRFQSQQINAQMVPVTSGDIRRSNFRRA
jgi:hypothetical protein